MALVIGRIYIYKSDGRPVRIFKSGGDAWYSGRGCTRETAIPYNHIKPHDVREATLPEVNAFLEQEMASGMAQTTNKR